MTKLSIDVPEDILNKLNEIAETRKMSLEDLIIDLTRDNYLTFLKEYRSYSAYLDYIHGKD